MTTDSGLPIPINNLSNLYINGLNPSFSPISASTSWVISAGQARDSTNTVDIVVNDTLTVNATVNGANGLDAGTFAADTWYGIYVISDPTNNNLPAGLFSTSFTQPTMPSVNGVAYSAFRLVGFARTQTGSAAFIPTNIFGAGNVRDFYFDGSVAVLSGGTATSFTTFSLDAAVAPLPVTIVNCDVSFTPAAAGDSCSFRPVGSGVTKPEADTMTGVVAAVPQEIQMSLVGNLIDGELSMQYINSAAACSTTVRVRSFVFYV